MTMTKDYVTYLNTLHNFNAQNENAFAEQNVTNEYYEKVMVDVEITDYIINSFNHDQPHILILTGHAGDGKTSIMYQVLKKLGIEYDSKREVFDVELSSNKKCRCIKDFSEFNNAKKESIMRDSIAFSKEGHYVFMIANTGPLINTFGSIFEDEERSEQARISLIDSIDLNNGEIVCIEGINLKTINIADLDNAHFATEFFEKMIEGSLWESCSECQKKDFCYIKRNAELLSQNKQSVNRFLKYYYIWLNEHGGRLTVRSMIEQLSFMLTGGSNCEEVMPSNDSYENLPSDLFFGFRDLIPEDKAESILAIKESRDLALYKKRLCADEDLIVKREFSTLFYTDFAKIVEAADEKNFHERRYLEFLRRQYFFFNKVKEHDEDAIKRDIQDIFSTQFYRYVELTTTGAKPKKQLDEKLIKDALSMIYLGRPFKKTIPVTMSREKGIMQNAVLITGTIQPNTIKLMKKNHKLDVFDKKHQKYALYLSVNHKQLNTVISLPLFNYFEELRNGIIDTEIDPQLSCGIENIKAELSQIADDSDEDSFDFGILKNTGMDTYHLTFNAEDGILAEWEEA